MKPMAEWQEPGPKREIAPFERFRSKSQSQVFRNICDRDEPDPRACLRVFHYPAYKVGGTTGAGTNTTTGGGVYLGRESMRCCNCNS